MLYRNRSKLENVSFITIAIILYLNDQFQPKRKTNQSESKLEVKAKLILKGCLIFSVRLSHLPLKPRHLVSANFSKVIDDFDAVIF